MLIRIRTRHIALCERQDYSTTFTIGCVESVR